MQNRSSASHAREYVGLALEAETTEAEAELFVACAQAYATLAVAEVIEAAAEVTR